MSDFTPTQGRYLAFILAYTEGFGFPPAESEIAEALKVSSPSVNQMIKTLDKKGLIQRQPGVPRSIKLLLPRDAIPKWKGKRLTSTRKVWVYDPHSDPNARVYLIRISLQGFYPEIWRRIETTDVTLQQLHELIQTAMGWTNSHMHQFEVEGVNYSDPRFRFGEFDGFDAEDSSRIRLSDLVNKFGKKKVKFDYEYDFGDGWQHEIVLEKVSNLDPKANYPRCIEGAGACPPEDIGGIYGFADYLDAITDPTHKSHKEFLEFYGPFDPNRFTPQKATKEMRAGLPMW